MFYLKKMTFCLHSTNEKVLVQSPYHWGTVCTSHSGLLFSTETFGISAESSRSPAPGPFSRRTALAVLVLTFTVSHSALHGTSFTRLRPRGPFHVWVCVCWLWRELIRVCASVWRLPCFREESEQPLAVREGALNFVFAPSSTEPSSGAYSAGKSTLETKTFRERAVGGPQRESSVFGFQV